MSAATIRVGMTETCNVYAPMPDSVAQLHTLAGRLDAVRQANIVHHQQLAARAAAAGVQVLCFGELFTAPYFALGGVDDMWLQLAEDALTGPTVTAFRATAREHRMVLVVPLYELDSSGRRYNAAVTIAETGDVLGRYRKAHIPAGSNEQGTFCEKYYYQPSDGGHADGHAIEYFPVVATSVCRIGVAICYDRHFEGVVRSLALNGAQLVFCPAVTFGAKSRRMWELEFAVDAARHNVFIAGSNRRGVEPPWNVDYFGASHFVGPQGRLEPLADAELPPQLVVADVPIGQLDAPDPSGWDLRRDARPDIYACHHHS